MIGCTKLLCEWASVSAAIHQEVAAADPRLMGFCNDLRPLVVWNTTRRCNLACRHCYLDAQDCAGPELTTAQARDFIADLGRMKVPVLLLSGGEPMLRPDLYELIAMAREAGVRPVLSTNGMLITPEAAGRLREAGIRYVGVSLDGLPETHDEFRGRRGAFDQAVAGLKNALAEGLHTGVRFTVNAHNYQDLGPLLDRVRDLGIPRFCMYHLVYAGRGDAGMDLTPDQSRSVIELVMERTVRYHREGAGLEILTVDNPGDGIAIYQRVLEANPERAEAVYRLLEQHGGCSAGIKIANVDPEGNVHPCQFWTQATLGNVTERPLSEIWADESIALLAALRHREEHLQGQCADCAHQRVCGGCRVRALAVSGQVWAEDPACYLTAEERAAEQLSAQVA
jgi:radical SAM protein with 4Fe4S-binding SPASM domain